MSTARTRIYKNVAVIGGFLVIFMWLAFISVQYIQKGHQAGNEVHASEDKQERQKRSSGSNPAAQGAITYTRWGRNVCPTGAEIVYKGNAAGGNTGQTGSGGDYVCLTDSPVFGNKKDGLQSNGLIYGAEFYPNTLTLFDTRNSNPTSLQYTDAQCAVCRRTGPATVLMIPGTKVCPTSWRTEYWGYLMSSAYTSKGRMNHVCVDNAPDAGSKGGATSQGGALMYFVEGRCGSLPCPPYVNGHELSCVVCSK